MVTPGPSCRVQRRRLRGPPADVREGVENAYIAITEVIKYTISQIKLHNLFLISVAFRNS